MFVAQLALIAHILSWLGHGLGVDSLHNQTWGRIVHLTFMLLTSSRIGKRFAAEAACKGRFATVTDTDVHVAHVSIVEGLRTLAALVILDPTVPEHVHLQVVGHAESLAALVAYKIRRFSPQLGTSYEVPLFFRLGVGSAPWFLFTDCGFSDPGLLCNWCLFFWVFRDPYIGLSVP